MRGASLRGIVSCSFVAAREKKNTMYKYTLPGGSKAEWLAVLEAYT